MSSAQHPTDPQAEFRVSTAASEEHSIVPSTTRNLLHSSLRLLILSSVALMVATPFLGNGTTASSVGFYLPLSLTLFAILKIETRGYTRTAAWALCLMLFTTISFGVLFFGGIKHHTAVAFVTVIILAALTIGSRAALGFGLLSAVTVLGLVKADQLGMTPTPLIHVSDEGMLSSTLLILGIVAIIMRQAILQLKSATQKLAIARDGQEAHAKSLQRLHQRIRDQARTARKISEIAENVIPGEFDEWRAKASEGIRSLFDAEAVCIYQTLPDSDSHLADWYGTEDKKLNQSWAALEGLAKVNPQAEPIRYLSRESHPEIFEEVSNSIVATLIITIPGRKHSLGSAIIVLKDELELSPGLSKDFQTLGSILGSSMERSTAEQKMRVAQRMETVGRLAGSVAHDFNNLLTTIMGCSQLLLDDTNKSALDRELLTDIGRAADHAALLTRKLLVLSRKQVVLLEPVDLNEAAKNFVQMANRMVGENIKVEFSPLPSQGFIIADPSSIEQILLNLAVNSRDAMPEGGRVDLSLDRIPLADSPLRGAGSPDEMALVLRFSDSGSGMSPHVLSHLFEPFFTTKGSGTGLGLASVREVVQELHGVVKVDSAPGRGTAFSVYIPEHAAGANLDASPTYSSAPSPRGESILLVDDNDHVRKTLAQVLKNGGYQVTVAHGSLEANEIIESSTDDFDLLLTDIFMPDISGIELASQLREAGWKVPILFMSGFADSTQKELGMLGDFISKPFTSTKLLNRIEWTLSSNAAPGAASKPITTPAPQKPQSGFQNSPGTP